MENLKPKDAADHLENLYPRTDPVYLTEQIRETALAILSEYPREKSALKLLSVCNDALDSGDYCQARIKMIKKAYEGIDISAWPQAKGGWERAKLYEADKAEFKRIGTEILTKRKKRKPSRSELVRLIARILSPAITDKELNNMANKRSKANSGWLPGDD
jgi:hypothetical protein